MDQLCRRCDWRPTLIRAHAELLQWSARVHDLCQSSPPKRHLLDGVFNEMIAILHHHAPVQRCHRRRRQPSWWTPECHQACVARNGAWRDHRRAPSAATRDRFHNARTSFHRVVRRCQNQFWSDWQENLTSLSRVNPRAAASRVRQMFSGQSRRDHTHLVRWPHFSSSEPPCPEGRSARHLQLLVDCRFCHVPVGDLGHCLSECLWFEDLRTEWCSRCGIPVRQLPCGPGTRGFSTQLRSSIPQGHCALM